MSRSTRKKTLRTIIYPRLALIMLAILLIFTLFAGYLAKQFIYRQSEDNLKEVSKMVYSYLSTSENTSFDALQQSLTMITGDSFTRITIIRDDGLVIADTDKDPALLENHGDRPEIIRASVVSPTLSSDRVTHSILTCSTLPDRSTFPAGSNPMY